MIRKLVSLLQKNFRSRVIPVCALITAFALGHTLHYCARVESRPPESVCRKAWKDALKKSDSPKHWKPPTNILWIRAFVPAEENSRLYGRYIWYTDADRWGNVISVEQIIIFLLPQELDKLRDVVTHEFLHAIYLRKSLKSPTFVAENPNQEWWVCSVGGCPEKLIN